MNTAPIKVILGCIPIFTDRQNVFLYSEIFFKNHLIRIN